MTARAVVLARGIGSRMRAADPGASLTPAQQAAADAGAKAMMPIAGRPFLDYVLSSLADAGLRDIGLVVAPDCDAIRHRYREVVPPTRIRLDLVVQEEARGTADAILAAKDWTRREPFLAMNADNLYPVPVLRALAALDEPGLPAFERDDLLASSNIPAERVQAFAVIELDDEGYLTRIIEKPAAATVAGARGPLLLSMNCWRFDDRIFASCRDVERSSRGEFELPEAVMLAVRRGVRFRALAARGAILDLSRRADAAEVSRRLAAVDVLL